MPAQWSDFKLVFGIFGVFLRIIFQLKTFKKLIDAFSRKREIK